MTINMFYYTEYKRSSALPSHGKPQRVTEKEFLILILILKKIKVELQYFNYKYNNNILISTQYQIKLLTVFDEKSNLRYFVNILDFTKYSYANVTSTIERTMFCEMVPMSSFEAASSAYCSILSTKSLLPCTFFYFFVLYCN